MFVKNFEKKHTILEFRQNKFQNIFDRNLTQILAKLPHIPDFNLCYCDKTSSGFILFPGRIQAKTGQIYADVNSINGNRIYPFCFCI